MLTGDVHSSWGADLTRDPNNPDHYDAMSGRGSLGVEMVCSSVTSSFAAAGLEAVLMGQNPALQFGETRSRGYLLLDLDHERARGSWHYYEDVWEEGSPERPGPVWTTRDGANHLVEEV